MSDGLFVAFVGERRVASGPLRDVLPVLKHRHERDGGELVLVFEVESGQQVDFDLRGSLDEVLARVSPSTTRGPGRPKLGVASREVSLLPRHWEWLEKQPNGASAALRRAVELSMKAQPGRDRALRIRSALSRVLSALAGNLPHYEEACRALFAGDTPRFALLIEGWPRDVRDYALLQATEAARVGDDGAGEPPSAALVRDLYRVVWSYGDVSAIERLVAPRYVIHSDPGDPWDGKTLDRDAYRERARHARSAFPDLVFFIDELLSVGDRVAVRWHAEGTHLGDVKGLAATGRRVGFAGQTMYEITGGLVAGHWQVIDRLGFFEQLRQGAPPRAG